jgi:hypothetical protein
MSVSRDAASAQEPGADLLAAAFLEAGFRHIAVQNTRTPVQRMNDVAAATLAHRWPRRSGALS